MENQRLPVTGGCLCGAIRYESTEPANDGGYCHCTMCQKGAGGFHAVFVYMPRSGFRLMKGEPKFYVSSETGKRGFCSDCGSSLYAVYEGMDTVVVCVGSLDHPEDWSVHQEGWSGHHSFVSEKIPWEVIADGLPQCDTFWSGDEESK